MTQETKDLIKTFPKSHRPGAPFIEGLEHFYKYAYKHDDHSYTLGGDAKYDIWAVLEHGPEVEFGTRYPKGQAYILLFPGAIPLYNWDEKYNEWKKVEDIYV